MGSRHLYPHFPSGVLVHDVVLVLALGRDVLVEERAQAGLIDFPLLHVGAAEVGRAHGAQVLAVQKVVLLVPKAGYTASCTADSTRQLGSC